MSSAKLGVFVFLPANLKFCEGWTNLARCSLEGSPPIMRFFVRTYFEDFLRKTAFFHFTEPYNI